jgi:hypothetical protein
MSPPIKWLIALGVSVILLLVYTLTPLYLPDGLTAVGFFFVGLALFGASTIVCLVGLVVTLVRRQKW